MRFYFYSLFFLFFSVAVYAQSTLSYVSFFPPANIVHRQVNLTQNESSFGYTDLTSGVNSGDYEARQGGLILGAADKAEITIDNISIVSASYAIGNFRADNIVRVYSTGTISNLVLGNPELCDRDGYCSNVFLSANRIVWPLKFDYVNNLEVTVDVENVAIVTNIQYARTNGTAFSSFLPGLSAGDNLEWRNLRINGTGKCLKYLTKNPPGPIQVIQNGECRSPNWSQQEEPPQH